MYRSWGWELKNWRYSCWLVRSMWTVACQHQGRWYAIPPLLQLPFHPPLPITFAATLVTYYSPSLNTVYHPGFRSLKHILRESHHFLLSSPSTCNNFILLIQTPLQKSLCIPLKYFALLIVFSTKKFFLVVSPLRNRSHNVVHLASPRGHVKLQECHGGKELCPLQQEPAQKPKKSWNFK